jgi:hypothetical protein
MHLTKPAFLAVLILLTSCTGSTSYSTQTVTNLTGISFVETSSDSFEGNSDLRQDTPSPSSTPEPAITYLAELTPIYEQVTFIPLGKGVFPYSEDRVTAGDALRHYDETYKYGLLAHAPSLLVYRLNGQYSTFRSSHFIPSGQCGDGAEFQVLIDGSMAYSDTSLPGEKATSLVLDVRGVDTLYLLARANNNPDCDWAVWGNPYVSNELPASVPLAVDPIFQVAENAPCSQSDDAESYIFLDCENIRQIRQRIYEGSPEALASYITLEAYLQTLSYNFPRQTSPTLESFLPYIWTGYDYPPRQLALMWLISGDEQYSNIIKNLLEQVTRLPVSRNWNDSSYGLIMPIEQSGQIYESLIFAYSTIRNTENISEEERLFYDDFFIRHAKVMQRWSNWTESVWNPGIRADAAMAIIASYFKDDPRSASLYKAARKSLFARIKAWYDEDGGYREYSDNYAPLVLESILLFAETEARLGNDIYSMDFSGKNLHDMCRWFLAELTPQGTLVGMNDGHWTPIDPGLLQLCGMRTNDGELIFASNKLEHGQAATFPKIVYFHRLAWSYNEVKPQVPSFTSVVLPAGGMAIFRSGWESADQYLFLQFTRSMHHQHYHTGSLVLHDGIPWMIDNGYPATTDEENIRALSSADHSTITLDDKNHKFTGGDVEYFSALGNSGLLAVSLDTYPTLDLTRSVLWIEPLHQWVVLDQAGSKGEHVFSSRWYILGKPDRLSPQKWQFTQGDATLQLQVFPSIDMKERLISRSYQLGDREAYGSSEGLMETATVTTWPVHVVTLLTTSEIERADSIDTKNGLLLTTRLDGNRESRIWTTHTGYPEVRQDDNNYLTGRAGCSLWESGMLIGYCLYDGVDLTTEGTQLIYSTEPISADVDFANGIITIDTAGAATLTLYWPDQVQSVVDKKGLPIYFTWENKSLTVFAQGGVQTLNVNNP